MQQIGKTRTMNRTRLSFRFLLRLLAVAALAGACLMLTACDVQSLSSLRSFSKPWQGAYECVYARCCGADLLENYREVVLTLEEDGRFTVEARPKEGEPSRAEGRYEYDESAGMLTFYARYRGKRYSQSCALENGSFLLSRRLAGLDIAAKFQMRV